MREIENEEAKEHKDGMVTVPGILKALREQMPKETLVLSEAISNYREQMEPQGQFGWPQATDSIAGRSLGLEALAD